MHIMDALVSTNTDASPPPLIPTSLLSIRSAQCRFLLLIQIMMLREPSNKPTPRQILRVYHTASSQLDALPRVIYPGEVDVQRRLDDAEHDGDGIEVALLLVGDALNPVEDVEGAVGAQADEVVGVDDRGDGGLAEEEELWENADGFEDLREDPEDLISMLESAQQASRSYLSMPTS